MLLKCEVERSRHSQYIAQKGSKWIKIRGLFNFLIIVQRKIKKKKTFGLFSEIKFLDSEEAITDKKRLSMYKWIGGDVSIIN